MSDEHLIPTQLDGLDYDEVAQLFKNQQDYGKPDKVLLMEDGTYRVDIQIDRLALPFLVEEAIIE